MVVEIGPLVAFQYFCSESGTKFRKVGTSSDFSPSSALSNTEVLGKLRGIGRTGIRQPSLLSTFRQSVPLLDPLSEKATGTDLTDAGDSSTADQGIAPHLGARALLLPCEFLPSSGHPSTGDGTAMGISRGESSMPPSSLEPERRSKAPPRFRPPTPYSPAAASWAIDSMRRTR